MNYQLFLIPLAVMFIVQVLKIFTHTKDGWTWKRLSRINTYGGMPSSHAAMVTSLAVITGYYDGLQSSTFAITLILALIIIRDAFGFRQAIGQQGKVINNLVKELPDEQEYKFPVLGEKFGHKTVEVIAGIIVGIILSYWLINIWP
ncbi:divergent PAP2 family protein [bacterium]|jgi:uncharacterized protein|nr:divergent PAP2 family protein [bacterium]MBT4648989.1 divergent PAP2 family protein [bacterium]